MPTETASLDDGAQWFATDAAGAEEIAKRRWPEGCRGAHGRHEQGWYHAPGATETDAPGPIVMPLAWCWHKCPRTAPRARWRG